MKENKRKLIKDVVCDLDKLPQEKRNRVLDIMQGMVIMDGIYRSGKDDRAKQSVKTGGGWEKEVEAWV